MNSPGTLCNQLVFQGRSPVGKGQGDVGAMRVLAVGCSGGLTLGLLFLLRGVVFRAGAGEAGAASASPAGCVLA